MTALTYRRPAILKQIPRTRHTVIEASAGTGKTRAIEYLVLDLLLSTDCSIEEILVVTFTEKATTELRARIRALLEGLLSGSASLDDRPNTDLVAVDDTGKRKLEQALFSFDRAPICTIHAFCRRILTDLAFDTGTAFDLEVVDAHRAFHRAFRSTLREVVTIQESTRTLLDEWMTEGETAGQANLVDSLEDLLRQAHFNRYLQSGARVRNQRAASELAELFDAALLRQGWSRKRKRVSADALKALEEFASIVHRARGSHQQLREALSEFDFGSFPYGAAADGDPRQTRLIQALDETQVACSLYVRVVDAFLPLVEDRLHRDKRQNNEIDYGDMLEWVWSALEGDRGQSLAALLRTRFRYGLVDEFQDTDDLQWKIFRRIFLESEGRNILYVVGDPKQAIYAFRGADVFTYLGARDEILENGGASVKLVDNHRSTSNLIDALNVILDERAEPALFSGDIRYDTPVRCGRPELHALDVNGNHLVPITLLRYCAGSSPGSAARVRAGVGRHIAFEIRRILFEPESAITISDNNELRRVEAGDIYILTRSGAEAVEIGGYLREQGIAFAFYKKDGLFQTSEAYDVLDILSAIEEPDSQSKRLKAWISPFFAVPYRDLFERGDVAPNHPLNELLYEWKMLADDEQFGILFDQLVHRSGLVSRELFLSNSGRELTNYLHIFEILLELILRERLSLRETIARLESFIAETALPAGIDSNIQRIESERGAVQIMTVHMSKGLQADVVFLFGGVLAPTMAPRVSVYHDAQRERRITLGKTAKEIAKRALLREDWEESERLAYVALTRGRAKLYLPVYPDGSTKRAVNGYYTALNNRLKDLSRELDRVTPSSRLFEQIDIHHSTFDAERTSALLENRIAIWSPIQSLLQSAAADARARSLLERNRTRSRAMQTISYTSLRSRQPQRYVARDLNIEEFKYDPDVADEGADLKGGRRVGLFLHDVIEKLDLSLFGMAPDVGSWRERNEIKSLFAKTMRRFQVTDARWFERGTEIVFNALTSSITTPTGTMVGPLYRCRNAREMEFVYPIPERAQPLLQSISAGKWSAERGYLKGFVDFVFEHDGLHYFADWKSDLLPAYNRGSIEPYVTEHYELQARIYSVGIIRLLGIRTQLEYEERFGGLLYLFIRGMKRRATSQEGIYFRRPDWTEICRYEQELSAAVPDTETIQ